MEHWRRTRRGVEDDGLFLEDLLVLEDLEVLGDCLLLPLAGEARGLLMRFAMFVCEKWREPFIVDRFLFFIRHGRFENPMKYYNN